MQVLIFHLFVLNIYYPEYVKYSEDNCTYVNIPYCSESVLESINGKQSRRDIIKYAFMHEMYKSKYGINFGNKVLKELCEVYE